MHRLFTLMLLTVATFMMVCWGSYSYTSHFSKAFLSDDLRDLPDQKVALMLGTSFRGSNGTINRYFKYRLDAALELYKAGKVQYILVSGDNSEENYNEPRAMRDALVKNGVPVDKVILDYAGFRTLDSMVRAKEVFGVTNVIVVSQKFHNERAIYLGRKNDINAFGYNARDVDGAEGSRSKFREIGARVKMMLDIYVLHTQPKFLGEPVIIP